MAKGDKNPLTEIMEEAEQYVMYQFADLMKEFGLPLYYTDPGRGAGASAWPDDPEGISPEEMQMLVNTRGEDAVNQWLFEHYNAMRLTGEMEDPSAGQ